MGPFALQPFVLGGWVLTLIAYAATLLAAGAALFLLVFPGRQTDYVRRTALLAAVLAGVASALLAPVQAGFLGGSTLQAAFDPLLLRLVLEGPLGTALALRLVGLALIATLLLRSAVARWPAALGVVLVAASFAQVGHTQAEPRALLATLLSLHVLAAAFWIGALLPLHRLVGREHPAVAGAVLLRFGQIAVWTVAGLVMAGIGLAWLLVGGLAPLFDTAYGRVLLTKVGAVGLLVGLAGYNKLRLAPAVAGGAVRAAGRLRAVIRLELVLVLLILALTAALTTLVPPGRG